MNSSSKARDVNLEILLCQWFYLRGEESRLPPVLRSGYPVFYLEHEYSEIEICLLTMHEQRKDSSQVVNWLMPWKLTSSLSRLGEISGNNIGRFVVLGRC